MNHLAERWCDLTPVTRGMFGAALLLLTGGFTGLFYPTDNRVMPEVASIRGTWLRIMPLAKHAYELRDAPAELFSAIDFQRNGCRLVSWQPEGEEGGELILESDWETLLHAFARLARQGMTIQRFSVLPEGVRLRFTLQLKASVRG